VARGVEDTAAENDYRTILCNTDEDPVKETNYLHLLVERRVDGVIIAPATCEKKRLALVKQPQMPCVLIDRRVAGFTADSVYGDSRSGARMLIDHLIDLGHRRIALINGPSTISSAQDRADGYRESLETHGIAVEESLIFKASSNRRAAIVWPDKRCRAIRAPRQFLQPTTSSHWVCSRPCRKPTCVYLRIWHWCVSTMFLIFPQSILS
jgi:LacI family transcriptional regulator